MKQHSFRPDPPLQAAAASEQDPDTGTSAGVDPRAAGDGKVSGSRLPGEGWLHLRISRLFHPEDLVPLPVVRAGTVLLVLLLGTVTATAAWRASAGKALQDSQLQAATLERENEHLSGQLEELLKEVSSLKKELDTSYAPVEIGGAVDFPVQRGMARPGDTVETFAAREGTTAAVVRALNPWLANEKVRLEGRQTLWIPKVRGVPVVREKG